MATSLRNPAPLTFQARSLSDAVDGTNAARGAMRALTNLVPDPTTRGNFVCRPAALDLIALSGTIPDAGFISGHIIVGDTLYGMVASSLNPGHDQPFAFDISVDPPVWIPVSGVTAANTPVSPPTTGKWVPPILAQVASRILVTHTGFPGGDIKFGWFDGRPGCRHSGRLADPDGRAGAADHPRSERYRHRYQRFLFSHRSAGPDIQPGDRQRRWHRLHLFFRHHDHRQPEHDRDAAWLGG
jgi:hypothetical protein